jgi:hypothetical protein
MSKMFEKIVVLNSTQPSALRLAPTTDWRFCASELLVPLAYTEMADAAREYPLVFLNDKPLVYALLGFEQGVNAYVADDGRWRAHYRPARLRAYPFALAPVPGQTGRFALVMDADAPQLLQPQGEPLFVGGQPGPELKARKALLEAMAQAEPATRRVVQAIRAAGLLVDRAVQVREPAPDRPALGGFQVIDERALNALPDAAFAALRQAGALPLVYAHLLSMANLRQGALAGRYPELLRTAGAANATGQRPSDMDSLLRGLRLLS